MPDQIPTNLRDVVLHPLVRHGRADEVARRLTEAIELGLYADGEQLPGEIELAAVLGIAPVTLREALAGLRQAGLLETRRGRGGGTFVSSPQTSQERLRSGLERWSVSELRDLGEVHVATAVAVARLASELGDASDLRRLASHIDDLRVATTGARSTVADSRFHIELAAVSRSRRLTRAEMELQAQSAGLLWALAETRGVSEATAAAAQAHTSLLATVRRRQADAAARVVAAHLRGESEMLIAARLRMYAGRSPGRARRLIGAVRATGEFVAAVFQIVGDARDRVLAERVASGVSISDPRSLLTLAELAVAQVGEGSGQVDGLGIALLSGQGEPRWAWWSATERGAVPLVVDLDSRHPDYYDYETAEWFTGPLERGGFAVAGPFLDVGGADDQICTFAAPVIDDSGRKLGVVGADISVRRLEMIVVPALMRIQRPTVLVTDRNVVLASNTEARPAGSRWTQTSSAPSDTDTVATDPWTGWRLVSF